jgi:hypothetical protein
LLYPRLIVSTKAIGGRVARMRSMNESKTMLAATGKFMVTGQAVLSVRGPLPSEHPLYATIGLITAEWAQLEHILDLIIWDLAEIPQAIGSCITGQMMGHSPRCKAIQTLGLLKGLDTQLLDGIQRLSNQLFEVAGERNRIIHDAWYIEHTSGQIGQFKSPSPKKKDFGISDIEMTTVSATLSKIQTKLIQGQKLRSDILDVLHT